MSIPRQDGFGRYPQTPPPSATTVRLVPLMGTARQDAPPVTLPPGSSISMSNFVPVGGELRARSRLSSVLTTNPFVSLPIGGIAELIKQGETSNAEVWIASGNSFGVFQNNTFSVASAVSAGGKDYDMGAFLAGTYKDMATTYIPTIDDTSMVIASGDTLVVTKFGTPPVFSYMTQAPRAYYVTSFDNYVLAFNVVAGSSSFGNRVQWSDRGDPFNWTAGGSSTAGFEDLTAMTGRGTGIKVFDGRLILFSEREIWVGVSSTYPAQFQFAPLDARIGCPHPRTIQMTPLGLIFLGFDYQLWVLSSGAAHAIPVTPGLGDAIFERANRPGGKLNKNSWGLYVPTQNCYYLFLDRDGVPRYEVYVVNLNTGTWGRMTYGPKPSAGVALTTADTFASSQTAIEPVMIGDYTGQCYLWNRRASTDSNVGSNPSVVTSLWQSMPIGTDLPGTQKLVTRTRIGYRGYSTSTATVNFSGNAGQTFEAGGQQAVFAPNSVWSEVETEHQFLASYPVMQILSTSTGLILQGPISVEFGLRGR